MSVDGPMQLGVDTTSPLPGMAIRVVDGCVVAEFYRKPNAPGVAFASAADSGNVKTQRAIGEARRPLLRCSS